MTERRSKTYEIRRGVLWCVVFGLGSSTLAACSSGPPPTAICAPSSAVKDKMDSRQQQQDAPPVFDPSKPGVANVGPSDGGDFGDPKTLAFTDGTGKTVRTITLTDTLPGQAEKLLAQYNNSHSDNSLALTSVDGNFAWRLVYNPPVYGLGINCPNGGPLYSSPSPSPSAS